MVHPNLDLVYLIYRVFYFKVLEKVTLKSSLVGRNSPLRINVCLISNNKTEIYRDL